MKELAETPLQSPAESQTALAEHGEPVPYADAVLRNKPRAYAEPVVSLLERDLIRLSAPQASTVGIFFVA